MKKIYLLYNKNDEEKVNKDIIILNQYGYKVILDCEEIANQLLLFDNDLDSENILLILNYQGIINNEKWLTIAQHFYKNNQTIMLLNDNNMINDMNPVVLEGNLTKLNGRKNRLLSYFSKEELERIKKIDDLYIRTFLITTTIFKNENVKKGNLHFEHLFRVSQNLDEKIEKVAALLHDILEYTEINTRDLKEIGITNEILEIVKLVTPSKINKQNLSEKEEINIFNSEIDKIINSGNIHAIRLKYADISDNYNFDKLKKLPLKEQMLFIKKYGLQLMKLKKEKEKYYDRYKFDKRK